MDVTKIVCYTATAGLLPLQEPSPRTHTLKSCVQEHEVTEQARPKDGICHQCSQTSVSS